MRSSISSSNERLPAGISGATWLAALLLAGAVLVFYELHWRGRGFKPALSDDANLWMLARNELRDDDPNQVVFLGTSRVQQGIDLDAFAENFGGEPPVQLAMGGSACAPVLRHLSEDTDFRGIVVCGVMPRMFFTETDVGDDQAELVRAWQDRAACGVVEARLRQWAQSALVLRLPELSPAQIAMALWNGEKVRPAQAFTLPDRSKRLIDNRERTGRRLRRTIENSRRGRRAGEEFIARAFSSLAATVGRIHARGGRVVFLYMPTSGEVRELEEKRFPRERYWDRLIAATGAAGIHYADHPPLQLRCIDGSHLNAENARTFSASLAHILKEKLPGRPDDQIAADTTQPAG